MSDLPGQIWRFQRERRVFKFKFGDTVQSCIIMYLWVTGFNIGGF